MQITILSRVLVDIWSRSFMFFLASTDEIEKAKTTDNTFRASLTKKV